MNLLIQGVRAAELGTGDIARTATFYTQVWGLAKTAETAEAVYLRGTAGTHNILTLRRGMPSIRRLVFQARSEAALGELHARIRAAGLAVSERIGPLGEPDGSIGFDSRDPEGRTITFAWDAAGANTAPSTAPADRFTRITHFNLNSGAYDIMRGYMRDVLGFRVIDETASNGFFNCDRDHHALVIGRTPMAPTLNHIAFEMPDLDSMMRMCGTMREHGYPIEWGVGRHGPGNNVFAYFTGPEEMPIECTAEVLQVDAAYCYRGPQQWGFPPGRTDQWGVTPPPTERIKRIQKQFHFADLPLR